MYSYSLTIPTGETRGVLHFGVQNYTRMIATTTAAQLSRLEGEALTGLSASDLGAITNFRVITGDSYLLNVTQPTTLTLATSTPGDGPSTPINIANPNVTLTYLGGGGSGTAVATDDNSVADGRNALLTYAVDATRLGMYRVFVGASAEGTYALQVSSSTAGAVQSSLATFAVSGNDLNSTITSTSLPAAVRVDFTEPVNFGSVSASDLTVAGVAASSVSLVDADTLQFNIGNTTLADGRYDVVIPAGAIQSLSGRALGSWSTQVSVDGRTPRIANASIAADTVLPLGSRTFSFTFDEPVSRPTDGLSAAQLLNVTTGQAVTLSNLTYVGADRITGITFDANLATEAEYRLTLFSRSDTFTDVAGNRLDGDGDGTPNDFVVRFFVDDVNAPLPPFIPIGAGGSLMRCSSLSRAFTGAGDVDSYVVDLEAGQTVQPTLSASDSSTSGRIELVAPDGTTVVIQANTGAIGQPALAPIFVAASAGRYSIRATGLVGSGAYQLNVLINAVQEAEAVSGPTNNDAATAQNIDSSSIAISGSADRLAVRGRMTASDTDTYSFTLAAGQSVMLMAESDVRNSISFQFLASGGQVLATAQSLGSNIGIENFTATMGGTYLVQIRSTAKTPYTLVATRNATFAVAGLGGPQDIGKTGTVLGSLGWLSSPVSSSTTTITGGVTLMDSTNNRWDINSSGGISSGTNNAYGGSGMSLAVNGSGFAASSGVLEEAGRELILGPVTIGNVQVTRKIYIPTNAGFARFLDIVTNNTGTATTANLNYDTHLGTHGSEQYVMTSSGDTVLTKD